MNNIIENTADPKITFEVETALRNSEYASLIATFDRVIDDFEEAEAIIREAVEDRGWDFVSLRWDGNAKDGQFVNVVIAIDENEAL